MNTNKIAEETRKAIALALSIDLTPEGEAEIDAIIQAAIDAAHASEKDYRDAIEQLVDWQNGPPLLNPKWLDGWNSAMEKACALIGRKHERQNN